MVRAVPYTPAPDDPPLPEARIVSVRRGDETLFEGVPFLGVVAIGFLSSMIFVTAVVVPLQLWTAYILGSWVFFIFLFMLLVCGQ